MNPGDIVVSVLVGGLATIIFVGILSTLSRRLLGVQASLVRIVFAGFIALVAEVAFEAQLIWNQPHDTFALIPIQVGIIAVVAMVFLVAAEVIVPTGTVPRPDKWIPAIRDRMNRGRRYSQITRIALKHGLFPVRKVDGNQTVEGSRARSVQARSLRVALEESGAAFVKLGQVLSTRPDVLPQEYLDELSQLQQDVPPAPWESVKELLEHELGAPLENVFAHFNPKPLAAASIGQVHRARLRTGEDVVVKV